ncbi:MAG: urea transporter, partial [Leptonema sp. (in: Bacteria)]|nr:urea transporter [Leptonema sp. (in: bacteria)]
LAAIIQNFFIKREIPVFTLPFVLVTWAIIFMANKYFVEFVALPEIAVLSTNDYFFFALKGYGQVIFQDSLLSGLIFFVAVFISSPIAALYGLAAALLSGIIALSVSAPIDNVGIGLFSFNAVLCAIVFANDKLVDAELWFASTNISICVGVVYHSIMEKAKKQ